MKAKPNLKLLILYDVEDNEYAVVEHNPGCGRCHGKSRSDASATYSSLCRGAEHKTQNNSGPQLQSL
jgi:hypothetical protein